MFTCCENIPSNKCCQYDQLQDHVIIGGDGDGYRGSSTSIITAGSCQSCVGNYSLPTKRLHCYGDANDTFPVLCNGEGGYLDQGSVECLDHGSKKCLDTDSNGGLALGSNNSLARRLVTSRETTIKDSIESLTDDTETQSDFVAVETTIKTDDETAALVDEIGLINNDIKEDDKPEDDIELGVQKNRRGETLPLISGK